MNGVNKTKKRHIDRMNMTGLQPFSNINEKKKNNVKALQYFFFSFFCFAFTAHIAVFEMKCEKYIGIFSL